MDISPDFWIMTGACLRQRELPDQRRFELHRVLSLFAQLTAQSCRQRRGGL
jgi:hypothetical protein